MTDTRPLIPNAPRQVGIDPLILIPRPEPVQVASVVPLLIALVGVAAAAWGGFRWWQRFNREELLTLLLRRAEDPSALRAVGRLSRGELRGMRGALTTTTVAQVQAAILTEPVL